MGSQSITCSPSRVTISRYVLLILSLINVKSKCLLAAFRWLEFWAFSLSICAWEVGKMELRLRWRRHCLPQRFQDAELGPGRRRGRHYLWWHPQDEDLGPGWRQGRHNLSRRHQRRTCSRLRGLGGGELEGWPVAATATRADQGGEGYSASVRVSGGRRLQSVGCIIWEGGGKTDWRKNLFEPEIVALNCNHRSLARFEEPELPVCSRVFSCNFKSFVCSILKTFVLHVLLWVLKK